MSKQKRFMIGAVIFYGWYIYTGAVFQFNFYATDVLLNKVLKFFAPLTWMDAEGTSSIMFVLAPILFFAATVIIDFLSAFTKKQKIVLTVLPVVSYALLWIFGLFAEAYFGHK